MVIGYLRVACASALILCAAGLPAAAQTGAVHGTVTDSATGSPLAGVHVEVLVPQPVRTTTTDARGRFRLRGLTPGRYTVSFVRLGYAPRRREVRVGPGEPAPIRVALTALGVPLDPVVVSVSRTAETALDAPASVSVVPRRTFEEGAALAPTEHVRTVTGVDFAGKGLLQHVFTVRGDRKTGFVIARR